jgi:hypothetical protein
MIDNLNMNYHNTNSLNPKQIIGLIVSQISLKFDEIIPLLSNSNDFKGTSHLEKFSANLKLMKLNFTIIGLNYLKSNIDEFIFENNDINKENTNNNPNNNQYEDNFSNESTNKKSMILNKFKDFSKFLSTIVNDTEYLKLESLNDQMNSDWEKHKNDYGLPTECNQECKCCKENLCVNEDICLNQIKINEKDQSNIFSNIFDFKFFFALIICLIFIFGIYYWRKRNSENLENSEYSMPENKESYDNDNKSIQRNDIEMT